MYTFPYYLCKKNSNIVLYGAGKCGLSFYVQLRMNGYCNVLAWVDKRFDSDVKPPFEIVNNINKYDYDYIVIAIENFHVAMDVKDILIKNGVNSEKIVWSAQYIMTDAFFPSDMKRLYEEFDFYMDIFDEYMKGNIEYGANQYYQSNKLLNLSGARNTEYRIQEYEIKKFLNKKMNVLNIGCNTGFLDIQIAPFVNHITGIDINKGVINVANKTAMHLEVENANFICKDVISKGVSNKYNAILLLAVHGIFEDSKEFLKITEAIEEKGYLLFESHEVPGDETRYINRLKLLEENGFNSCLFKIIKDGGITRMYSILRKG